MIAEFESGLLESISLTVRRTETVKKGPEGGRALRIPPLAAIALETTDTEHNHDRE
jgi:hypothetical protein